MPFWTFYQGGCSYRNVSPRRCSRSTFFIPQFHIRITNKEPSSVQFQNLPYGVYAFWLLRYFNQLCRAQAILDKNCASFVLRFVGVWLSNHVNDVWLLEGPRSLPANQSWVPLEDILIDQELAILWKSTYVDRTYVSAWGLFLSGRGFTMHSADTRIFPFFNVDWTVYCSRFMVPLTVIAFKLCYGTWSGVMLVVTLPTSNLFKRIKV